MIIQWVSGKRELGSTQTLHVLRTPSVLPSCSHASSRLCVIMWQIHKVLAKCWMPPTWCSFSFFFCPYVSISYFSGPCYSRVLPDIVVSPQVWTSLYIFESTSIFYWINSPSRYVSCPLPFQCFYSVD